MTTPVLVGKGILREGSIGYNACPDILTPRRLVDLCGMAEKAGFEAIWVSDHFHPWFDTGAYEYHTWTWMGAAMETIKVPFGTAVTAPTLRYHPAIVAQAFATMEGLFGPRVILGVGTGEAMNEAPLGFPWPKYPERRDRLIEAVEIIKKLWEGGFVDYQGEYYHLKGANLYMKASIPVVMSALGPKMAKVVGKYGDGIITVTKTPEYVKNVLFPAVKEGCKEAGRSFDDMIKVVELDMAHGKDYDTAIKSVRKWAATLINEMFTTDISDPRKIEARGMEVTDEQLAEVFPIGTDEEAFIKAIEQNFNCGFQHVYVQLNTLDDEEAVELFRKKVLPYFK